MNAEFEWDAAKATSNYRKHGVDFTIATRVFRDVFGIEVIDNRMDYGEVRLQLIGRTGDRLLTMIYTERETRIRIISARQATKGEHERYHRENAQE